MSDDFGSQSADFSHLDADFESHYLSQCVMTLAVRVLTFKVTPQNRVHVLAMLVLCLSVMQTTSEFCEHQRDKQ